MNLKQSVVTQTYNMTLQRNLGVLLNTQNALNIINLLEPNHEVRVLIKHLHHQNKSMMEWFTQDLNSDIVQSLILTEPSIKRMLENDIGVIEKKYMILKTYTENIGITCSLITNVNDVDLVVINYFKENILSKLRSASTSTMVPVRESMTIINSINGVSLKNTTAKSRRNKFVMILIKLLHDMFLII